MKKRLSILFLVFSIPGLLLAATLPAGLTELPKGDPVRKAVERTAATWGDENITSSGLRILAYQWKPGKPAKDDLLRDLGQALLPLLFKDTEDEAFPARPIEISVRPFSPEALGVAAELVSDEGFCYDPKNKQDRRSVLARLTSATKPLDLAPDQDRVAVCHARVKLGGDWRNLNLFLFANVRTMKVVALYVREGSM